MRTLTQVLAITAMNLRNLPQRVGTSLVVVVGIAGVVGVLVSVLAMAEGFRHTLASTGRADRVIMLRAGSDAELSSGVDRDQATLLASLPGVARDEAGRPQASAELVVMVDLPRKGESNPNNVPFRGVQRAAFTIRDEARLVEGRRFEPGVREVMVGRKAAGQFAGLAVGSRIGFRDSDWTVVGIFESGGDVHESEIWADAEVAMSAFRRTGYQSVTAKLTDPSAFPAFESAMAADPRLDLKPQREREYYEGQSATTSTLIRVFSTFVTAILSIGAVFGAMNTMYAAVAYRTREIGTLRALGFSRFRIVSAFLAESVALALVGGVVGCILALPVNGLSTGAMNMQSFSELAFKFRVTPGLIVGGMVFAAIMGAVGGLLPALRAARLPVAYSLREI